MHYSNTLDVNISCHYDIDISSLKLCRNVVHRLDELTNKGVRILQCIVHRSLTLPWNTLRMYEEFSQLSVFRNPRDSWQHESLSDFKSNTWHARRPSSNQNRSNQQPNSIPSCTLCYSSLLSDIWVQYLRCGRGARLVVVHWRAHLRCLDGSGKNTPMVDIPIHIPCIPM